MTLELLRGAASSNPRATAALALQALGASILPWAYTDNRKKPTRYWAVEKHDPMTADEIRNWWISHASDNVGVITGHAYGLADPRATDIVGIDLDTPEALAWAKQHLAATPWRTRTGRDGQAEHWVYRQPSLPPNHYIKTNVNVNGIKGLDVRGEGGYVAVPPSLHKSGRLYEWISRPQHLNDLPFLDLSLFPSQEREILEDEADLPPASGYAMQQAAIWLRDQRVAIEGQAGRARTFSVCISLRRGFTLSLEQALEVVEPWNRRCEPPWDPQDLRREMTRAYTEGSEEIGVRLAGAAAGNVLRNLAVKPPVPVAAPAEVQEESLIDRYEDYEDDSVETPGTYAAPASLASARDLALTLPADARLDVAAPFETPALQAAATLKRIDLPGFIRLRHELKSLGNISMKDWDRAVSRAGSPLRTREQLEAGRINDGDRQRVVLSGDDKALRDDIIKIMAESKTIYSQGDGLCYLAGDVLTPLQGDKLHNAILEMVHPVQGRSDKSSGEVVMVSAPLPRQAIGLLGNLLPEHVALFRQVDQVLRFPFCTSDEEGRPALVMDPGYDKRSKTVLVSTGGASLERFAGPSEALDYLLWLIKDFPFVGPAERDNYLGLLLQLLLRPYIQGITPPYIIEGNQANVGKSLLSKLPLLLAGVIPAALVPWPDKGAEEATKNLPTLLETGEAVIGWDNVRGEVASTSFESLFTSRVVRLRYLGTSNTGSFVIKQLWILSSNNATLNRDMARRSVRIRLVKTDYSRQPEITDFEAYCGNNRGEILSALLHLVQKWIVAGAPVFRDLPVLESYETWGQVVGSVLRVNGLVHWMENKQEARATFAAGDEWVEFTQAWYDAHKEEPVTTTQLWMVCQKTNLLATARGDGNDKSQQTRLGAALRKQTQAVHSDGKMSLQINICPQRANTSQYQLKNLSLTIAPATVTVQKAG